MFTTINETLDNLNLPFEIELPPTISTVMVIEEDAIGALAVELLQGMNFTPYIDPQNPGIPAQMVGEIRINNRCIKLITFSYGADKTPQLIVTLDGGNTNIKVLNKTLLSIMAVMRIFEIIYRTKYRLIIKCSRENGYAIISKVIVNLFTNPKDVITVDLPSKLKADIRKGTILIENLTKDDFKLFRLNNIRSIL